MNASTSDVVSGSGAGADVGAAALFAPPLCTKGMSVGVLYAPAPRMVWQQTVQLPAGSSVAAALHASGLLQQYGDIDLNAASVTVWGRRCTPDTVLDDGDRVEVCRPLKVDPKAARRARFRRQGARTAGLFVKDRSSTS